MRVPLRGYAALEDCLCFAVRLIEKEVGAAEGREQRELNEGRRFVGGDILIFTHSSS